MSIISDNFAVSQSSSSTISGSWSPSGWTRTITNATVGSNSLSISTRNALIGYNVGTGSVIDLSSSSIIMGGPTGSISSVQLILTDTNGNTFQNYTMTNQNQPMFLYWSIPASSWGSVVLTSINSFTIIIVDPNYYHFTATSVSSSPATVNSTLYDSFSTAQADQTSTVDPETSNIYSWQPNGWVRVCGGCTITTGSSFLSNGGEMAYESIDSTNILNLSNSIVSMNAVVGDTGQVVGATGQVIMFIYDGAGNNCSNIGTVSGSTITWNINALSWNSADVSGVVTLKFENYSTGFSFGSLSNSATCILKGMNIRRVVSGKTEETPVENIQVGDILKTEKGQTSV